FETQKIEEELELKVDYILCAGFMKILSKKFLEYFQSEDHKIYKVVNIHPSLLPSFPGKNGYGDAFHYGVKVAGVTTHFVDEKIDNGPILYQESFKRLDSDDLESFTSRGLSVEYELYKKTIQVLQNNNFKVEKFKDRFFVKVVEPKHES
ncbi:MAG: formyltransferase family protein, partial [Bacteriovoracaceae bacterium]